MGKSVAEVFYTCVHVDNCQGGSGKVMQQSMLIELSGSDTVDMIDEKIRDRLGDLNGNSYSYRTESVIVYDVRLRGVL